MVTLRQIEAFQAICETGSFAAAARRLGATQPAISKRIGELEAELGAPLFERGQRQVRPTLRGHALRPFAETMLTTRERLLHALAEPGDYAGTIRIGVTELTALTFLPEWIAALRAALPRARVVPEVKLAQALIPELRQGVIELAVMPGPPPAGLVARSLGPVEMAWMCSPTAIDCPDAMPAARLSDYPILAQTERSGLQAAANDWLEANGATAELVLSSNSLSALCGLTIAGLGVALLPRACFQHQVRAGRLKEIVTDPPMPPLEYFVVHGKQGAHPLGRLVADLAIATARFDTSPNV
ncbi:LysR family transcriptional regulator [Acetobacteraceae bacterium H6797]|nr:LysR family transcriptional regulator [Acetobacteraceae bacterium H6797]